MSSDIASDADDSTPYLCAPYYDKLKDNLEPTIHKIFNWFKYNNFGADATKCYFLLSLYQSATINIDGSIIESNDFTFGEHINTPCWESSQTLHVLFRISQYLSWNRKRILFKTFAAS